MASPSMETNNVFSGPHGLRNYYDPDFAPPLPLVELPGYLNPMRDSGVRIYAKMMTMLPAHNVKALPAINLLSSTVVPGRTRTAIEYSSGSTVISLALAGRVLHGLDDTRAYLSNKTTEAKLRLMQFFGLRVRLFGGPAQPASRDPRGGIQAARREAEQAAAAVVVHPDQYENEANWRAHYRWTGPQLLRQLPHLGVVCAGMGTAGTMTGIGLYLADHAPAVFRLGCCTAAGQRVPGPRPLALMDPVGFPWRRAVDAVEEVGELDAYRWSLRLSREGLVCGPSSGFNLQGLLAFLAKRELAGTLRELAGPDREVHCVFLCCDLPYQYMDEYFAKLADGAFPPIENRALARVDLHRYDESWELPAAQALARFFARAEDPAAPRTARASYAVRPGAVVVDLRRPADFARWHLPGSRNLPLDSLAAETASPFGAPDVLARQWRELEALTAAEDGRAEAEGLGLETLRGAKVLFVCYDGDTARVATSVFHARHVDASSLKDGTRGMESQLQWQLLGIHETEGAKGLAAEPTDSAIGTPASSVDCMDDSK